MCHDVRSDVQCSVVCHAQHSIFLNVPPHCFISLRTAEAALVAAVGSGEFSETGEDTRVAQHPPEKQFKSVEPVHPCVGLRD